MTYIDEKRPDIRVGIIELNTSGVSVSDTSPIITLNPVSWKTSNSGSTSVVSNNIVLPANKKFILQATLSFNYLKIAYSVDRKFRWYNETNSTWLGKDGICESDYEAYLNEQLTRLDESARAIVITGSSSENVSLKYSGTTSQTFTVGNKPSNSPWNYITAYGRIEIWEFV